MQGQHIIPTNPKKNTTMYSHNITCTIISHLYKTIKKIISKHLSLKYWSSHNRDVSNLITYMSLFQHAEKNPPIWQRRWLSKWSCGMCVVGKCPEHLKEQNHSKCPRCLTDNETLEHVIHFPHQDAALCCFTGL